MQIGVGMTNLTLFNSVLVLSFLTLAGCSSPKPEKTQQTHSRPSPETLNRSKNTDLIPVIAALHDQMHSWEGTPYHWGGTELTGVDCSGFVWRTLKDRFNLPMDRVTTSQLIQMGKKIEPDRLQPGDLVFFRIQRQMHVGFYDTDKHFLHASASKGVIRSSLTNPYWKSVFLEARRLPKEQDAQISFNYADDESQLAKN